MHCSCRNFINNKHNIKDNGDNNKNNKADNKSIYSISNESEK